MGLGEGTQIGVGGKVTSPVPLLVFELRATLDITDCSIPVLVSVMRLSVIMCGVADMDAELGTDQDSDVDVDPSVRAVSDAGGEVGMMVVMIELLIIEPLITVFVLSFVVVVFALISSLDIDLNDLLDDFVRKSSNIFNISWFDVTPR